MILYLIPDDKQVSQSNGQYEPNNGSDGRLEYALKIRRVGADLKSEVGLSILQWLSGQRAGLERIR